jgi:hypothetical protein
MFETQRWQCLPLIFALCALSTTARAQESQIRVSSHEVWVDISVINKRTGNRVDGSTEKNFTVTDADKPVINLHLSGTGSPAPPLTVALRNKFAHQQGHVQNSTGFECGIAKAASGG